MKLSVALCTYNGALYLREQARSIAAQTRQADEVVACDDGSIDATEAELRSGLGEAVGMLKWGRNPVNLGSTQNFAQTIGRCSGDVVVFCDQDDVWEPRKLAVLEAALGDPGVAYVFSDADLIDPQGVPLGVRLWQGVGFGVGEQRSFSATGGLASLVRKPIVTGATMAFRSEFKPLILPIPDCWVHDGWIAILLSAVSKGLPIAEPLIRYRQHPTQQIGEKKRGLMEQYRIAKLQGQEYFQKQYDAFAAVLVRLESQTLYEPHPWALPLLRQKVRHCEIRLAMRKRRSLRAPAVLSGMVAGRYGRLDRGWKAAAQDLLL